MELSDEIFQRDEEREKEKEEEKEKDRNADQGQDHPLAIMMMEITRNLMLHHQSHSRSRHQNLSQLQLIQKFRLSQTKKIMMVSLEK